MHGIHVLVDFVRPESLPTGPTEICPTATGYIVAATILLNYAFAFWASFTMGIDPFIE